MPEEEQNQPPSFYAFHGESYLSQTSCIANLEFAKNDEATEAFTTPIKLLMTPEAVRKARSPPLLIHSIESRRMKTISQLPKCLHFPVLFPSRIHEAGLNSAKSFRLRPRYEKRRGNTIDFIRKDSSC